MKFIDQIAEELMIEPKYLSLYLSTAPHRYKVYWIDKKNGRKRQIAQPARMLKQLQREILTKYFEPFLPVHETAMAYKKGTSIKDNAQRHCSSEFLLKMDFANFFPSIVSSDFVKHVDQHIEGLGEDYEYVIEKLFFRRELENQPLQLSIGAPSSPFISNTLLFNFDVQVSQYCSNNQINYTRYADDLTFSATLKDKLVMIPEYVESTLKEMEYPELCVNNAKTISLSKKHRRRVTGLVLSNNGTVSIGRDRKRKIRAMAHSHMLGKLSNTQVDELRGFLSFAYNVEPEFYARLKEKFSTQSMSDIFF